MIDRLEAISAELKSLALELMPVAGIGVEESMAKTLLSTSVMGVGVQLMGVVDSYRSFETLREG